jgi:hypothetical protein
MLNEFHQVWRALGEFCKPFRLAPNQWEVTYVNHIPAGSLWAEANDWKKIINLVGGGLPPTSGFGFEGIGGEWHFEILPRRGRLHVELQRGKVGGPKGADLILLKLTSRGPITVEGNQAVEVALDAGLQLGHDVIVKAFTEMTSKQAHEVWEREQ